MFVVAFAVLGALILASYVLAERRRGDLGLTSEIACLTVFLLGGLCADGQTVLASAIGVGVAFLLSIKRRLHGFARRVKQEDLHAVIKFAALTIVIMPLLPEEPIVVGKWLPAEEAVVAEASPGGEAAVTTVTAGEAPAAPPSQEEATPAAGVAPIGTATVAAVPPRPPARNRGGGPSTWTSARSG